MGIVLFFAEADLEHQIIQLATRTVIGASISLIVLTVLAIILNKQPEKRRKPFKLPLFLLIAITMVGTTGVLFGGTVYLNMKSESGGPVHWHTGLEFWACGAEVNLRDPTGFLSNKIGTATYHEHNDKYIHLEGVVVKKSRDASLSKFMEVTGGYITDDSIGIPLTPEQEKWFASGDQIDGDPQRPENFSLATGNGARISQSAEGPILQLKNGNTCGDTNTLPAELQVFLFRYNKEDRTYTQQKLEKPGEYVMRDESILGPPSDCVIVEFDTPKSRTDKICQQYGIKDAERCTAFGVSEFNPDLCYLREMPHENVSTVHGYNENEPAPTNDADAADLARKCRRQEQTDIMPSSDCVALRDSCQNANLLLGKTYTCAVLDGDSE